MEFRVRSWYARDQNSVYRFIEVEDETWKLPAVSILRDTWIAEDPINRCKLSPDDPRIKMVSDWKPVKPGVHRGL